MTLRAAIYVRASLDRSGEGAAVGRQEADCRALAEHRGYTVVALHSDNDTSASSGKRRPGWEALLAAVRRGQVDVILAYHLDRVARRMTDLEQVIGLGVPVVTCTGDLDLSNDQGRLLARVLGSVAQGEVERKGARQRRANAERAQAGRPAGGWRPFGYDDDRTTVRPVEAEAVREAYAVVLAGGSLRAVARAWNAAGHRTSPGGSWRADNVRTLLRSPRYAGLQTYRAEVIGRAAWDAVVPEDTWRATQAVLTDPGRRTTPGNARQYLLSGLATCAVEVERDGIMGPCGALTTTGRTQRKVRALRCSVSNHLNRKAEPIEEFVVAVVLARLAREDAADLVIDHDHPDVDRLREEALAVRARIADLSSLVADGVLTAAEVREQAPRLRERLARVETTMADAGRADVLGPLVGADDVRAVWDGLDVDRQRAVVGALMHVALRSPGRGVRHLDPGTVVIDWLGQAARSSDSGS